MGLRWGEEEWEKNYIESGDENIAQKIMKSQGFPGGGGGVSPLGPHRAQRTRGSPNLPDFKPYCRLQLILTSQYVYYIIFRMKFFFLRIHNVHAFVENHFSRARFDA